MNCILDWRNAEGRPICNEKETGFVENNKDGTVTETYL